jgi:hypothetical protein
VFSLAVGTVIEAAMGPYKGKQTGENSLFRTLHPSAVLVARTLAHVTPHFHFPCSNERRT